MKVRHIIKQIEALNVSVIKPSKRSRTATHIFIDNITGEKHIAYKTGYVRGFSTASADRNKKVIRQQFGKKLYMDNIERLERILKYYTKKRNRK